MVFGNKTVQVCFWSAKSIVDMSIGSGVHSDPSLSTDTQKSTPVDEADETTAAPDADKSTGFLSKSRVKQLTVVSLSLSNLGCGCFFTIIASFFPPEVSRILIR